MFNTSSVWMERQKARLRRWPLFGVSKSEQFIGGSKSTRVERKNKCHLGIQTQVNFKRSHPACGVPYKNLQVPPNGKPGRGIKKGAKTFDF